MDDAPSYDGMIIYMRDCYLMIAILSVIVVLLLIDLMSDDWLFHWGAIC